VQALERASVHRGCARCARAPARRLIRVEGRNAYFVPYEKPPLDRYGREWWPPGWHAGRRVETERDIFELVNLPYRPPHERQAP